MQSSDLTNLATIDTALRILSWCVIGFGALWLITSVIGFFHRRAYNLTHAESGRSKNIRPDFLKVDKARREAAIEKGKAYDAVLDAREVPPSVATVATVGLWSRLAAITTATLAVVAAVVGTVSKVDSIQAGVNTMGSWDRLGHFVGQNKAGTVVAVIVIGANIVVYVNALKKKTPEND
jgi:hypothetical protein